MVDTGAGTEQQLARGGICIDRVQPRPGSWSGRRPPDPVNGIIDAKSHNLETTNQGLGGVGKGIYYCVAMQNANVVDEQGKNNNNGV